MAFMISFRVIETAAVVGKCRPLLSGGNICILSLAKVNTQGDFFSTCPPHFQNQNDRMLFAKKKKDSFSTSQHSYEGARNL